MKERVKEFMGGKWGRTKAAVLAVVLTTVAIWFVQTGGQGQEITPGGGTVLNGLVVVATNASGSSVAFQSEVIPVAADPFGYLALLTNAPFNYTSGVYSASFNYGFYTGLSTNGIVVGDRIPFLSYDTNVIWSGNGANGTSSQKFWYYTNGAYHQFNTDTRWVSNSLGQWHILIPSPTSAFTNGNPNTAAGPYFNDTGSGPPPVTFLPVLGPYVRVGSIWGSAGGNGGLLLATNSPPLFPTSFGEAFMWNSNGDMYMVQSAITLRAWTSTNLIHAH